MFTRLRGTAIASLGVFPWQSHSLFRRLGPAAVVLARTGASGREGEGGMAASIHRSLPTSPVVFLESGTGLRLCRLPYQDQDAWCDELALKVQRLKASSRSRMFPLPLTIEAGVCSGAACFDSSHHASMTTLLARGCLLPLPSVDSRGRGVQRGCFLRKLAPREHDEAGSSRLSCLNAPLVAHNEV